jgi:hypothetical protein
LTIGHDPMKSTLLCRRAFENGLRIGLSV